MGDEDIVEKIRKKYERLSEVLDDRSLAYGHQLKQKP